MGGFFGERKDEILDLIPNEYLAKTIVIKNANLENLANQLKTADLNYPLIAISHMQIVISVKSAHYL